MNTDDDPTGDGAKRPGTPAEESRSTAEMPAPQPPAHALIGRTIGNYRIKRIIASGGMGSVYEAIQESPRRTVALKVMKHGIASRSALRRFEYESQILARLRHPGIAQVYEAGTHDDGGGAVPYFAMEYIPNAKPITQYARDKKFSTKQRLELFAKVCDAVNHGHQKGIIHRDLKPGNILVDSHGQPKVIDFGVARATDSDMAVTTLQTDVGQLIGTLQYMSPEQCDADPHDIDTRSDVYALGVVLYEMLCEQLPYDVSKHAVYEAARVIREQAPTRLSSLNKTLRGDVETIALKALEKDRARRYLSAADFGADITRYLNNEPIIARRASMLYHARTFARRNKALVGGVAAILVVFLAGIVATTYQARRATALAASEAELRRTAERQSQNAQQVQAFIQRMFSSLQPRQTPGYNPVFLRRIFDDAARQVEMELADQPAVAAEIRTMIGSAFVELGLFSEGASHLERAIAFHREHGHAVALAESLTGMAQVRNHQSRIAEAEEVSREALAIFERELGPEHPRTIEAKVELGWWLLERDREEASEANQREAFEVAQRVFGDGHRIVAEAAGALAMVLDHQGRAEEAEPLNRYSLEILRRIDGPDHPRYYWRMTLLAWSLLELGRYEEAENLLRRSITFYEDDELLAVGNPGRGLARALVEQGRFHEAEELYLWILEVTRRTRPTGHRDIASVEREWGRCLTGLGRYEEAEEVLIRTYVWWERNRGSRNRFTQLVMTRIADLYEAWDKPDKAREWHQRLEEARMGGEPPRHESEKRQG